MVTNTRSRRSDIVTKRKPKIIAEYNKYVNGVNKVDQYCTSYPFSRKSLKWWRKTIFWEFRNLLCE